MTDYQSKFTGEEIDDRLEKANTQVDWLQNNNTKVDFLKNKPFGEAKAFEDIVWNGDTTGLLYIPVTIMGQQGYYYKVSDEVLTREQLKKSTLMYSGILVGESEPVTEKVNLHNDVDNESLCINGMLAFSVAKENDELSNVDAGLSPITIPEPGIWFLYVGAEIFGEAVYTMSLITPYETVKINPKYIPGEVFGDNMSITVYFSQAETPDPINFEYAPGNFVFYKLSDAIPTIQELIETGTVTTNGVTEKFSNGFMQSLGEDIFAFGLPSGHKYAVASMAGRFLVDAEHDLIIDIPETGTYYACYIGTPLPEGLTVELNYVGTKKIHSKYLPIATENSFYIAPQDFTLETDPDGVIDLSLSKEIAEALGRKVSSGQLFVLKVKFDEEGVTAVFQHSGAGSFYMIEQSLIISLALRTDKNVKGFIAYISSLNGSSTTATTYGMRQPAVPTFAEFMEMLTETARERGLI